MGVSGGAKGALEGPSMMPGGTKTSYDAIESLLNKMAAQVEDGPCVTYIGPGGSGHFVKTVHNGIEYGIEEIDWALLSSRDKINDIVIDNTSWNIKKIF